MKKQHVGCVILCAIWGMGVGVIWEASESVWGGESHCHKAIPLQREKHLTFSFTCISELFTSSSIIKALTFQHKQNNSKFTLIAAKVCLTNYTQTNQFWWLRIKRIKLIATLWLESNEYEIYTKISVDKTKLFDDISSKNILVFV